MPIQEYLERTTQRQHETWLEWLSLQLNKPSRADYYIMRLMAEMVAVVCGKQPDLDTFRVDFVEEGPKTKEKASEASKAKWVSGVGLEDGKRSRKTGRKAGRRH